MNKVRTSVDFVESSWEDIDLLTTFLHPNPDVCWMHILIISFVFQGFQLKGCVCLSIPDGLPTRIGLFSSWK